MEYLTGTGLLCLAFLALFLYRPDLRYGMLWSGALYVFVMSMGFIATLVFFPDLLPQYRVVPGYWHPRTLFDMGTTFGYAIEDVLFGFFTGAIAFGAYRSTFKQRVGKGKLHIRHVLAITGGGAAGLFTASLDVNLVYALITFGLCGALIMWAQRPDLIEASLLGGTTFLLIYITLYFLFTLLFPYFVSEYYELTNTFGLLLAGIPLEEFLWAFSFGIFWSPLFDYMRDVKEF